MICSTKRNKNKLTIKIDGILDSSTVPELEKQINLKGLSELVFVLDDLESISSSGIRVLLYCQQIMNSQGSMKIYHPCDFVYEIFELTGLDKVFDIER